LDHPDAPGGPDHRAHPHIGTKPVQCQDPLGAVQLAALPLVEDAYGVTVAALVPLIQALGEQIAAVATRLVERFKQHPDAELLLRLPGPGTDPRRPGASPSSPDAPNRYTDAKARRNYAGTAPITRASDTSQVVLARLVRNRRGVRRLLAMGLLRADGLTRRASLLRRAQPGPRTSKTARRKLANKLVGILHGVLEHRSAYDEQHAWSNWLPTNELTA
jgi:hypothetical protein